MTDIAALAGVHQTTVSLALRNHPGIPAETRDRIRVCADKIGYHPDPALDAFNFHRLSNHPLRSAPVIALVSDLPSIAVFEKSEARRDLYLGAKTGAERLGFVLERFFVGPRNLSPSRLNEVLKARNIDCVILASFSLQTADLALDWNRLCGLKVESFHVRPQLDVITSDHQQSGRLAFSRLWSLGYRRIGMVLTSGEEERLANLQRAGYLVELERHLAAPEIPLCNIDGVTTEDLPQHLAAWIGENRLEAIISDLNALSKILQQTQYAIAGCPGFASLDVARSGAEIAGVAPNHFLVGKSAVELIAMRRYANRRGVPEQISITFVPVSWQDGQSAPGRRPMRYADFLGVV